MLFLKERKLDTLTLGLSFQLLLSSFCFLIYQSDLSGPVLNDVSSALPCGFPVNLFDKLYQLGGFAVSEYHDQKGMSSSCGSPAEGIGVEP